LNLYPRFFYERYELNNLVVKVIPNAKRNKIVAEQRRLKVYVTAPAVDGKANKVLIEILAEYLQVKKNKLTIIRGDKSREKVIQISP
jgi:uncharacterized protein